MSPERRLRLVYTAILVLAMIALVVLVLWTWGRPVGRAAAETLPDRFGLRIEAAEGGPSERTVENLLAACLSDSSAGDPNWCEAYLMGVADMMTALGKGGHKAGLCGGTYDPETLGRIYTRWAHEHREFWDYDMLLGAHLAFREAWPCR